jgi:hypothetical protein
MKKNAVGSHLISLIRSAGDIGIAFKYHEDSTAKVAQNPLMAESLELPKPFLSSFCWLGQNLTFWCEIMTVFGD